MSHITKQSERDENEAIHNCRFANVELSHWVENEVYGGERLEHYTENQCGPTETISFAKDKCLLCGKVFTY